MATVTAASSPTSEPDGAVTARFGRLRLWNIGVGLVLAAQAVLIAVLTNGFSLPVTATFMKRAARHARPRLHHLFDVPAGLGRGRFSGDLGGRPARDRLAAGVRLVHGPTFDRIATTRAGSSTSSARRS